MPAAPCLGHRGRNPSWPDGSATAAHDGSMAWRAAVTAPVVVGRTEEQRQLLSAIRGAAEGQPVCVVVHGEAGVGKTRLVREVVAALDAVVLWGTCVRFGSSVLPFAPLISALRDVLPDQPDSAEPVPFVRMVDTSLGAVAARRPAILVIDDLQWADQSSLDALAYVIAGFRGQRLAVIATRRDEPLSAGHPLYGWLADMRRMPGFAELALSRLDLGGTADLVASINGGAPDLEIAGLVHARSGGNPYLTELLLADLPPGAHDLAGAVPHRLREALSATWHRLGPVARDVARIVAVGGRPADVPLLAAVAARQGIDAIAVSDVLTAPATQAVLVQNDEDLVWFRHPLLADVLGAAIPPAQAAALHAAFAEVLSARPEPTAADLAVHYAGCGAMDDAFDWSLAAAAAAEAVHASAEAAQHLRRACGIWSQVSAPRRGSVHDRVDLLERAGVASQRVGHHEDARRLLEEALDLVDESAEPLRRSRLLGQWCDALWGHAGEEEAVLRQQAAAVRLTEAYPNSAERSLALSGLARVEFWAGQVASARDHASAALEAARRAGSDLGLARALNACALGFTGSREELVRLVEELQRAAYASGNVEAIAESADGLAALLEDEGHLVEASEALEQAFIDTKRLGERRWCYFFAAAAADDLIDGGRFDRARGLLQEALVTRCVPPGGALPRLIAAKLAIRVGDLEAARTHVDRALQVVDPSFSALGRELLTTPSELLSAEGDLVGAAEWIKQRLRTVPRFVQPPPAREPYQHQLYDRGDAIAFLFLTRALADLACRARDERRPYVAERVVAELAEWEDGIRRRLPGLADPAVPPTDPDLLMARAEMSRCRDDPDQVDRWQQAVDRCHDTGFVWNEACGLRRLAEALIALGAPRTEIAVTVRRLHELATGMGAGPLQDQAETLARVARIPLDAVMDPSTGAEDGPHSPLNALTAREREVLGHLVAGRTNSEIAHSLVISEKTVSVHVTNILHKTGTSSRAEAAAWATRVR